MGHRQRIFCLLKGRRSSGTMAWECLWEVPCTSFLRKQWMWDCSHLTLLYPHLLPLCSSSLLSQLEVQVWFKYSFDKACIFLTEIRSLELTSNITWGREWGPGVCRVGNPCKEGRIHRTEQWTAAPAVHIKGAMSLECVENVILR